MPNGLMIHGRCYPIDGGFRRGLRLWNLARQGELTLEAMAALYFPEEWPEDLEAAAEGIRRFFLRRDQPPAPEETGPIPYDFRQDADRIIAGFQEKYGMDLTDPGLRLHWWRFMALLEGLMGPDLGTLAEIRTRDLSSLDQAGRQEYLRLRRIFGIRDRQETLKEHLGHLDEIIARHETTGGKQAWQTAELS